jgi:uncharacterized protein with HEPN domain
MKETHLDSYERLQHIANAIDRINKYVMTHNSITFVETDLIHDAVLFQFSIIGEAINFVEPEILNKYEYPWYKVRSFRYLISHEYFNIKMDAVWQIIETNLPELQLIIKDILEKEF